jgi:hypothetical protein
MMSRGRDSRANTLERSQGGAVKHKSDLATQSQWAVTTSRGWLVRAEGGGEATSQ